MENCTICGELRTCLLGDGSSRPLLVERALDGCGTDDDARRTGNGATGVEEACGRCQRQRVVMRKPTNMMPKPIRMFHEFSDGTGSVPPET